MKTSNRDIRICVACNEDGFGPSAFAYYLVRRLIEAFASNTRASLDIRVLNFSAADFNRKLYGNLPVRVEPIDSLVRFEKANGEVHVPRTLERLQPYAARRESYANDVRQLLTDCAVAIDIGVPLFSRAAAQFKVPHRLTLFDHSWAATLRLIASEEWQNLYQKNPPPGPKESAQAERIAAVIEKDEACVADLFLFANFLTPDAFLNHWQRLGVAPQILPGVLGGRVSRADACAKLDATLAEYGAQLPAPRHRPLVLLSPGGTPVWDDQLPKLLEQVLDAAEPDYILILSKDLGQFLGGRADLLARVHSSERLRYFGPLRGATQQAILPAFSRIVTRAGGGTVNDAIAAGVEFVFIEEAQVQVKLIERECTSLGLTGAPATLEEFRADPKQCLDRLVGMPLPKPQMAPAHGAEAQVVQQILSWLK